MTKVFPVFIPSKGRAENSKTIEHFESMFEETQFKATVVVEKEDYEEYSNKYKNVEFIVLQASNQGIAYVRNWILEFNRNSGNEWYWMLDDDISNFYHREGTKMIKDNFLVLEKAQEIFTAIPKIGQAALEYQQFAWGASKDYSTNSYQDVCVCINAKKTGDIKYREYVNLKEDRDFTMQIIKAGLDTCRVTLYAFSAPKNGSNKGGLKDVYDTGGREETASKRMVELWGNTICRFNVKEDGRPDVKIMWPEIRKAQISMF